jgi:hypothetical protein
MPRQARTATRNTRSDEVLSKVHELSSKTHERFLKTHELLKT